MTLNVNSIVESVIQIKNGITINVDVSVKNIIYVKKIIFEIKVQRCINHRFKNDTYNFFDHIINIKNVNSNKIKIDEKLYKNILIYYIGYVTIKDLKYKKIGSVNPLYLIINKMNDHLTLVPANESKEIIKKYKELWSKIRDLIGLITKDSNDYDEKYM